MDIMYQFDEWDDEKKNLPQCKNVGEKQWASNFFQQRIVVQFDAKYQEID